MRHTLFADGFQEFQEMVWERRIVKAVKEKRERNGADRNREKRIWWKRLFVWLPAVGVAAAIFFFSSQPASESTQVSNWVIDLLVRAAGMFGEVRVSPEQMVKLYEILSTPVRKCAHMTEYLILYGTLIPAVGGWRQNRRKCLRTALLLTVLYACTDEFHQLFVPGRAGRVTDVLIDSTGALVLTAVFGEGFGRRKRPDSQKT